MTPYHIYNQCFVSHSDYDQIYFYNHHGKFTNIFILGKPQITFPAFYQIKPVGILKYWLMLPSLHVHPTSNFSRQLLTIIKHWSKCHVKWWAWTSLSAKEAGLAKLLGQTIGCCFIFCPSTSIQFKTTEIAACKIKDNICIKWFIKVILYFISSYR